MTKFAIKGLLNRKLRTALTAIAIVLGVAMVCGTYVLTDSITQAFNAIFASTYQSTDAVVTGRRAFSGSDNGNAVNPNEWWDAHWIQDRILRKLRDARQNR